MTTACMLVNCERPRLLFSSYFLWQEGGRQACSWQALLSRSLDCFGLAFPNIPPEHRHLGVHTVHTPYLLSSLYLLGAAPSKMQEVYENESIKLVEWPAAEVKLSKDNWRDYLGYTEYRSDSLSSFRAGLLFLQSLGQTRRSAVSAV